MSHHPHAIKKSFLTRVIDFLKFAVALILSTMLPRFVGAAIVAGVMTMFTNPLVGLLAGITTVVLVLFTTDYVRKLENTAIQFTNWMFRGLLAWSHHRDAVKQAQAEAKKEAAASGVTLYIPDANGFLRPVSN